MRTILSRYHRFTSSKVLLPLLVFGMVYLICADANSYFDPASGSSIVQIIVGVFLAAAVAVKVWFRRIRRIVLRLLGKGSKDDSAPEEE